MKLTKRQKDALCEVSEYSEGPFSRGYCRHWREKSVRQLVEMGLVEDRGGERPFWITEKGIEALTD